MRYLGIVHSLVERRAEDFTLCGQLLIERATRRADESSGRQLGRLL